MRYLITGCAGFIGSHLTDHLLAKGHEVVGLDNLSTGTLLFLKEALKSSQFTFIEADLLHQDNLNSIFNSPFDNVFHLAANADVRFGTHHPHKDLEQNTLATFNVLEAMRVNQLKRLTFASTGSIYGESALIPTPEDAPFPIQTSLYGASKLAAEGLIAAYCEGFDFKADIFRFVSILGERYTHGHVFDFYRQLIEQPDQLTILGDGHQKKSYLNVQDCIHAMLHTLNNTQNKINIFNLGTDEYCEVNQSIDWITEYLHLSPKRQFTGGERGWIGDNPFIFLDCKRIRQLGWKPHYTIQESIIQTVKWLEQNTWVFSKDKKIKNAS